MATPPLLDLPNELMNMILIQLEHRDYLSLALTCSVLRSCANLFLYRHITLVENTYSAGYHRLLRLLQQLVATFHIDPIRGSLVRRVTVKIKDQYAGQPGWEDDDHPVEYLQEPVEPSELTHRLGAMTHGQRKTHRRLVAVARAYNAGPNVTSTFMGVLVLLFRLIPKVTAFEYVGANTIEPLVLSGVGFFQGGIPSGLLSLTGLTMEMQRYHDFRGGYSLHLIRNLFALPRLQYLIAERVGTGHETSIEWNRDEHLGLLIPSPNHLLQHLFIKRLYTYDLRELAYLLRPLHALVTVTLIFDQQFDHYAYKTSGEGEEDEGEDSDEEYDDNPQEGVVYPPDEDWDGEDSDYSREASSDDEMVDAGGGEVGGDTGEVGEGTGSSDHDEEMDEDDVKGMHFMSTPRHVIALLDPSAPGLSQLFIGIIARNLRRTPLPASTTLESLTMFPSLVHARLPMQWVIGASPVAGRFTWTLRSLPPTLRTIHFDLDSTFSLDLCVDLLAEVMPGWQTPHLEEIAIFWNGKARGVVLRRDNVRAAVQNAGIVLVPVMQPDYPSGMR